MLTVLKNVVQCEQCQVTAFQTGQNGPGVDVLDVGVDMNLAVIVDGVSAYHPIDTFHGGCDQSLCASPAPECNIANDCITGFQRIDKFLPAQRLRYVRMDDTDATV